MNYVQSDIQTLPYTIKEKNEKPMIEVTYKGEKKTFQPEEISNSSNII